jgi:hypothetical protein
LSKTELSRTLVNSYRVAHYKVTGADFAFTLMVKKQSTDLLKLMKRHGVESAAFITAYNPGSKKFDRNINIRSQKALKGEIQRMGLPFFNGMGEDPTDKWGEGEPSYLVLGMGQQSAEDLGKKFGQNAVLWIDPDAVPHLVLLR